MEGVSYSLRDCMEILREMGLSIEHMMACGGGGSSSVWRQMLADLYGCPVATASSKESAALGAAFWREWGPAFIRTYLPPVAS